MNSSTNMLLLEGVCARYPDSGPGSPYVLDGVSFGLHAGSGLVALTGPNGCGKTTILRVVMGQLDIDKGAVWFRGRDVTSMPTHQRRGISCIFQRAQDGLCASLTIEENLCLALTGDGLRVWRPLVTRDRHDLIRDRAHTLVGSLSSSFLSARLAESLHKCPAMFSGGELQQLCLFAAMIQQPPPHLLLADEPTLNLDRANRGACVEMLSAISKETVVLVATHDMDLVSKSDCVLVMERGQVSQRD